MKKSLVLLLIIGFNLSGCSLNQRSENPAPSTTVASNGEKLWLYKEKKLVKINTAANHEEAAYPITEEFLPVNYEYGQTFKVSDDETLVVWFVPAKGMVRWSAVKKDVKVIYEPTSWFYENPYFQFFGKTHELLLVDKRGTEVVKINLDNDTSLTQAIPYPFGTIFKLSPDLAKTLYIEGYQQTTGTPQYLITNAAGEELARVKTNAEVADRALVGWTYDSNRIITIENQNEIVAYTLTSPTNRQIIYELHQDERVVELKQQNEWLFIGTRAYWYLFNTQENKLIRRLPVEAMSQLNKPKFIFAADSSEKFFIEETVRSYETMHKRMWVSDWMGGKSIVVPGYGVETAQSVIF